MTQENFVTEAVSADVDALNESGYVNKVVSLRNMYSQGMKSTKQGNRQ